MLLVMWIPVLRKYNIVQESKAVHHQQIENSIPMQPLYNW